MKHIYIYFLLLIPFLLTSCGVYQDAEAESNVIPTENVSAVIKNELRLDQDGTGIYGNLYCPADWDETQAYPLIILSHSANVNSDTLHTYAERSAALGYLAYTFDFPGGSRSSRSDSVDRCTIFTEMETLRFIIDYFDGQTYTDGIYLFGTSQGGLVSSVVADEKEDQLSGLILFYPAYNIPELMAKYAIGMDAEYKKQLKEYDVYDHIGNFSKDVLIVHGTGDIMVPCSYSEKASELYDFCQLELVEGANHGFNRENYAVNNSYDEVTWGYVESYLNDHKN